MNGNALLGSVEPRPVWRLWLLVRVAEGESWAETSVTCGWFAGIIVSATIHHSRIPMAKARLALDTAFRTYEPLEQLGEGGAGRVLRVKDANGREYAAKILNPDRINAERRKRFQNEIMFCMKDIHPNVLRVIDHGATQVGKVVVPFYVMPLYSQSLRKVMAKRLSPDKALPLFSQLLMGVEAAHRDNVVHRDLKPENILLRETDSTIAVADFGIAHFVDEELYTAVETNSAARLANFVYAAPEQKERGHAIGPFTDIYALGLILNELFTGRVPAGTDFQSIASASAEHAYLDDIVSMMLQQDPAKRPQTIDAINQILIGRRKEFVTRQEFDRAKQRVVPLGTASDPLIDDPPRIIDFDWDAGTLTLVLSRPVTGDWISAFQNIGSRHSVMYADVTDFRFVGDKALVRAEASDVQRIVNHFKDWIPKATQVYVMRRAQAREQFERHERQRLQAEQDALAKKLALRQSVRL